MADAQEADFVLDPEMKEAGMPGVASRELLLQNQEASIRERMRHEIVFKTNENCRVKYLFFFFLCGFRWMFFSTFPRINFEGLGYTILNIYWVIRRLKNVVLSSLQK